MSTISLRKVSIFILAGLLTLTFAPASFAQSAGVTVEISVAANGYPEKPSELVPGAYINMYSVIPVRAGVYEGVLVETAIAAADGKGPLFKVQPGQIVNFVTFKDATKAKNTNHWTFTTPPYKNFTAQDGTAGRLCQINFLDKENKMKLSVDGSYSCSTSLGYPLSDAYVVIAASDLSKPLGDFEVWVQQTNEPTSIISNATVRLFDAGTNAVIGKAVNGQRGIMTFILERERKFYYDGWFDGVMYGGYKTPYVETPRVFYITSDGRGIRNAFDNALSYVLRVGAYPNTQSAELPPPPTPTSPTPTSPSPTPAPTVPLGQSKILQPEEGQMLTNYPRIAKISWGEVANAFNYQVVVECDLCGSTTWGAKMELPSVSSTETQTSALWGDNKYRVRVRAVAKDGTKGPWSDYRYFSYKTTGTGVTTQPAPLKVGTIDLEYRYFLKGVTNPPEKGKITLTLSSDYKNRGYNFKDLKYTSVSGGAFYVTDTDKGVVRFYGNNVGQGGLYTFGKANIDEVIPPTEKAKYNRFGLPVYSDQVYAVYDEANGNFALIAVTSLSSSIIPPTTAPSWTPLPTLAPTTTTPTPAPATTPVPEPVLSPYFDDFIDDFVEEGGGDVDIELKNANAAFGKKSKAGKKGFQFKVTLENNSEDIARAILDVRCDALTDEGRVPLVSYSKQYDVKPGSRSFAFFQGLSEEQAVLVRSLQKAKGTVNCNFAVTGVVDFDTGLTVPDADSSNNRIDIQLHWKGGKLRVNTFSRVGL